MSAGIKIFEGVFCNAPGQSRRNILETLRCCVVGPSPIICEVNVPDHSAGIDYCYVVINEPMKRGGVMAGMQKDLWRPVTEVELLSFVESRLNSLKRYKSMASLLSLSVANRSGEFAPTLVFNEKPKLMYTNILSNWMEDTTFLFFSKG